MVRAEFWPEAIIPGMYNAVLNHRRRLFAEGTTDADRLLCSCKAARDGMTQTQVDIRAFAA
ncbi:MAG TPA: hypothetical protein VG758_20610, partial [Hyphomicrobiaceae bacterium]|nr:hypothetical protein [Hyphomicrobiaceae bacterium]